MSGHWEPLLLSPYTLAVYGVLSTFIPMYIFLCSYVSINPIQLTKQAYPHTHVFALRLSYQDKLLTLSYSLIKVYLFCILLIFIIMIFMIAKYSVVVPKEGDNKVDVPFHFSQRLTQLCKFAQPLARKKS